jgi:DNA primase
MARIPDTEIERLKTEISLERLVASAGIELQRHGADLIGRCPFHEDRTPSLVVSPQKNLWHCLGACQTGGSVIDWVMKTRGVSFRHAVELLKEEHPSLAAPLEKIVWKDTTTKLDAPIALDVDDQEIILRESLLDALTFWCSGFRNVTASYGVGGFTDDHRTAFEKYGVKQVWIAYDRDEAGDNAAERLKEELLALGIGCRRVLFPKGMDANEYALKVTPASQSLAVLLNKAEWLGKAAKEKNAEEPKPVISLAAEPVAQVSGDEVVLEQENRRYRIRGLGKNLSHELLKVNVLVSCGDLFHVDTLDLYSAQQRAAFTNQASEELHLKEETLRRDLGRALMQLEKLQDEQIRKALSPEKTEPEMSEQEQAEALALLRDPKLLDRILEHFEACGIVGEETNKLIGYLAAVSRHLDTPLAVVCRGTDT